MLNRSRPLRRPDPWAIALIVSAAVTLTLTSAAAAQDAASDPSPNPGHVETSTKVVLGAALGLVFHESGHLFANVLVGETPGVKAVSYAGIPFFAITHQPVGARKEFAISSAGFWAQHVTSELILSRRPHLRHERAPVLKGVLAFNVLVSVVYASAALGRTGPPERDTRGIAVAAGISEPGVAPVVFLPAALDTVRYFRPLSPTARWASRAAKVASVLLILRAHQ